MTKINIFDIILYSVLSEFSQYIEKNRRKTMRVFLNLKLNDKQLGRCRSLFVQFDRQKEEVLDLDRALGAMDEGKDPRSQRALGNKDDDGLCILKMEDSSISLRTLDPDLQAVGLELTSVGWYVKTFDNKQSRGGFLRLVFSEGDVMPLTDSQKSYVDDRLESPWANCYVWKNAPGRPITVNVTQRQVGKNAQQALHFQNEEWSLTEL